MHHFQNTPVLQGRPLKKNPLLNFFQNNCNTFKYFHKNIQNYFSHDFFFLTKRKIIINAKF